MSLIVNGETVDYQGALTLAALLQQLGADGDRVATMLNDEIIRKEDRQARKLIDGDRVEVLVFAGGG